MSFLVFKQKSKNMFSFETGKFLVSICFVFDCVIHEDNYSCPDICTCLSFVHIETVRLKVFLFQPN